MQPTGTFHEGNKLEPRALPRFFLSERSSTDTDFSPFVTGTSLPSKRSDGFIQFASMGSTHPAKANCTPRDRIRFIVHQGKQILLVDLSHCQADQLEEIVRQVPQVVNAFPRGSVLILSDFTGAFLNEEALRAMKEAAVFDKAYVKKSALVGTESIPPQVTEDLSNFSRRLFPAFKSHEESLAWLVKD